MRGARLLYIAMMRAVYLLLAVKPDMLRSACYSYNRFCAIFIYRPRTRVSGPAKLINEKKTLAHDE